jgi:hypothetical protein
MRFTKIPVEIEAKLFTGDNMQEMIDFIGKDKLEPNTEGYLHIFTLEGTMTASKGDWIIRGVHGEFYPCKPDIFKKTYSKVPRQCKHTQLLPRKDSMSGYCAVCDEYTDGWYCPDSPDNECHYMSERSGAFSYVELRDGRRSTMPEHHDPRNESWDSCIFCGQPEERK